MNINSVNQLPSIPAVYAMYGGSSPRAAYVGVAGKLKQRIIQHLVRRDSSVTTGTSVVSLNPDLVTRLNWWTHPRFESRDALEAAELIAFDVLDPVLRSTGNITDCAKQLYENQRFVSEMQTLFMAQPAGELTIRSLENAFEIIEQLTERLADLEKQIATLKRGG